MPTHASSIVSTSPGTDAAAAASAAFTSCSALYSNTSLLAPPNLPSSSPTNLTTVLSPLASLINTTYAQTLLTHGQALYTFATSIQPQQVYQTAVPAVASSYGSSGFQDDLVLAGLFLSLAQIHGAGGGGTENASAYADAKTLWKQEFQAPGNTQGAALNWDSKSPMLAVLGAQIVSGYGAGGVGAEDGDLDMWKTAAETYLDDLIASGKLTKGAFSLCGRITSSFFSLFSSY